MFIMISDLISDLWFQFPIEVFAVLSYKTLLRRCSGTVQASLGHFGLMRHAHAGVPSAVALRWTAKWWAIDCAIGSR